MGELLLLVVGVSHGFVGSGQEEMYVLWCVVFETLVR